MKPSVMTPAVKGSRLNWVEVEVVGEVVQPDLQAVEQQQHQHEVGHAPDDCRVNRRDALRDAVFRELGRSADQAKQERHDQGDQR
jgi:hypothetical protein